MKTLVSLNPFSDMRRMVELMDRAFTPFDSELNRWTTGFNVPLDIWEKEGNIMVKAAAPGIKPEDLDVTFDEGVLTISGEIRNEHEDLQTEGRVYQRETRYGKFSRSVRLPEDVDDQAIDAELKDGFILVSIPRKQLPLAQPKRVEIRSAASAGPKAIDAQAKPAQDKEKAGTKSLN